MLDTQREKEIREHLEQIYSSPEFVHSRKAPGLLDSLADWVKGLWEWLRHKLEGIGLPETNFSILPDRASQQDLLPLKIVGVLILAVILFFLCFFILRNLRSSRKIKEQEDAMLLTQAKSPDALLESALSLSRNGDFRQGFRYLYLSLLVKFNEWDLIRIDKSKTNRQYLNEIEYSGFSRLEEVRVFTEAFNELWYGMRKLDGPGFERWFERYQTLLKGVRPSL